MIVPILPIQRARAVYAVAPFGAIMLPAYGSGSSGTDSTRVPNTFSHPITRSCQLLSLLGTAKEKGRLPQCSFNHPTINRRYKQLTRGALSWRVLHRCSMRSKLVFTKRKQDKGSHYMPLCYIGSFPASRSVPILAQQRPDPVRRVIFRSNLLVVNYPPPLHPG